ncbi:bark storage protein A-like isoform X1 [Canna indica]|uniref:Bark storage protein A-like isoform X1 n=1 Tax=Canna indica TaxID=4628 RepID=A0AAQ3QC60_9LILI|nr:bark storage protein A-like isoform X1 [Canna indica]
MASLSTLIRSTSAIPRTGRWMSSPLLPAFLLLLLLFVRCSSALPKTHPLRAAADRVNRRGPYIGLVMAFPAESEALQASGVFVPASGVPFLDLFGRRFHIGSIHQVKVIYVMSGQRRLNAGITVQTLLDVFDVRGIVHYGTAGSANDSMSFGDVSVPKFTAFTGSWTWMKLESPDEPFPELHIGEFNIPSKGGNSLSRIKFKTEEFYSAGKQMEEVFWLQTNPEWFQVAEQLEVELQRCVNESYCLPEAPKIVFGLKASTADVFLDNAAYREFLFKEFGVSTVDEESAAVVMTAMSANVPVVVFRGVSDLAGGEATWSSTMLSDIASINALKVAVSFIAAIGKRRLSL